MKIASHNSFTYLRPRRWWMRLLAITARCQRVNFNRQLDLGAQMLDLRVRFVPAPYGGTRPMVCHGLIEYEDGWQAAVNAIQLLDDKSRGSEHPYYIRVVLESRRPSEEQKERFRDLCGVLTNYHRNVVFFGGNDRSDWSCKKPVYDFGTPLPDIDEKHASTTALFPRFPRLDDLCPILYSRLFNHRDIEQGTTHDWLMIDFVDIR